MLSKTFVLILLWSVSLFFGIAFAQEHEIKTIDAHASDQKTHVLLFDKERLFIQAKDIALKDLMSAIANQIDISIIAYISLDKLVTVDIEWYSIDETLKSILRDNSYVYAKTNSPTLWILPQDGNQERGEDTAIGTYPLEPIDTATPLQLRTLSDHPEEREQAMVDFVNLEPHNAIDRLTSAITDPAYGVREAAIVTLTLIGGAEVVDALSIALADQEPRIREEAIDALGEIGGERVKPLLQQALYDEVAFVRHAAREALDLF